MKARILLLIIVFTIPLEDYAQTRVNRSVAVQAGQSIQMHFDYPKLIRVTTWDKNEVSILGDVSINGGENDDAFVLENTVSGKVIKISSEIKDIKNLPQRITITRDGQKIMFSDKESFNKYKAEHGGGYNSMSWGPHIEIELEIKVPRNTQTHITSVYGMVEVKDFTGPLAVEATYGGVDAALAERSVGELTAETNYGQIYSNLDTRFGGEQVTNKDFYTLVKARPGSGPKYNFESTYGNVYLRKAAN
jgi:hypothetical protein